MLNSPERHNENILKYNMININESLILSNKLILDTIKDIHYINGSFLYFHSKCLGMDGLAGK